MNSTYIVCEKCLKTNRVQINSDKTAVCGSCKTQLNLHGAVVEAGDSTLELLIKKSPLPVVIDVWAPWCGPCRQFAPTFNEASQKFAGQVVFAKVNSDTNPKSAIQLNVRGIPSLVIYKQGQEVARQSGALPSDYFSNWIKENI